MGDYAGMLGFYTRALSLSSDGPCAHRIYCHFKVGSSYYYLRQRPKAMSQFFQAVALAGDCPQDTMLSKLYRVIASIHFEEGDIDSSRYYLRKTEHLLLRTTNWKDLSALYAIMGEAWQEDRDRYFRLAEDYALRSGDTALIAFAYVKQGVNAAQHGDCEGGIRYLHLARDYYDHIHYTDGVMYAYRELAYAYKNCGDVNGVYDAWGSYAGMIDSIFRKETAEKTAHYQTLYETEKKERENMELTRNRRQLIAGFVFVVLVLVLAFIIIYSRHRLRQQRQMARHVAEQQQMRFAAVVEAEENERRRIAVDLHDGLGQTMSAAKINLSALQDDLDFKDPAQQQEFEKIVALIDQSCKDVRTVSHSMMPNTLLKMGLAEAIRAFLNQISQKVLDIHFYSAGLDQPLDTNTESVLYRVVQECVNNVIKHAGASRLHISIIADEEGISITIEDNGRGFRLPIASQGMGLQNIRSRIGYLRGTVEWDTAPGKGTVVTIQIPGE